MLNFTVHCNRLLTTTEGPLGRPQLPVLGSDTLHRNFQFFVCTIHDCTCIAFAYVTIWDRGCPLPKVF